MNVRRPADLYNFAATQLGELSDTELAFWVARSGDAIHAPLLRSSGPSGVRFHSCACTRGTFPSARRRSRTGSISSKVRSSSLLTPASSKKRHRYLPRLDEVAAKAGPGQTMRDARETRAYP